MFVNPLGDFLVQNRNFNKLTKCGKQCIWQFCGAPSFVPISNSKMHLSFVYLWFFGHKGRAKMRTEVRTQQFHNFRPVFTNSTSQKSDENPYQFTDWLLLRKLANSGGVTMFKCISLKTFFPGMLILCANVEKRQEHRPQCRSPQFWHSNQYTHVHSKMHAALGRLRVFITKDCKVTPKKLRPIFILWWKKTCTFSCGAGPTRGFIHLIFFYLFLVAKLAQPDRSPRTIPWNNFLQFSPK